MIPLDRARYETTASSFFSRFSRGVVSPYLSARVRVDGGKYRWFNAVLNYGVSDAVVNGVATPFTTQTAKLSLCKVDGMYGGKINGTTRTVGF